MKNLYRFLLKHFTWIIRITLMIVSILVVLYFFPREGKFRYEFQKGKPWGHDALIAPFNFPVYKSDNELSLERDSILKEFKPYFNVDTNVVYRQLEKFSQVFQRKWAQFVASEYLISDLQELDPGRRDHRQILENRDLLYTTSSMLLSEVYSSGIVEVADILSRVKNVHGAIVTVRGHVASERDTSAVFTQKRAYSYILTRSKELINQTGMGREARFLADLDLNEFIEPNLFYDELTSGRIREQMISQISLTRGMVQEGERIISRGDLVDNVRFRILESLRTVYQKNLITSSGNLLVILGQLLLITACFLVILLFLLHFRNVILQDSLKSGFIFFMVVLFFVITALVVRSGITSVYLVPLTIIPIVIRTFYDARLALFIHIVTILLIGFLVPNSFEFIFLNFLAGIVAIFSLTNIYRRGKLFLSAVMIFITYSVVYFGIAIIQESNLYTIEWKHYLWFAGNSGLVLLSYPLMYVFEKTFSFISDATLFELSDTNQPLLRKLAETAPGTFQHSLQVANLAEEAAISIGANPMLIRTGALYHDIGKMNDPIYFIENQTEGINPHDSLEFEDSARIIIDHVKNGVEIARKYQLPSQIVDFIRTHHGTGIVHYFYRSYIKKYPEQIVDSERFTYPGPRPFSKEMAIVMMADSVEAASRSLKTVNREVLHDLVEKIIAKQIEENQFTDADITFRNISQVKEIFKRKLENIYHARIEYPKA